MRFGRSSATHVPVAAKLAATTLAGALLLAGSLGLFLLPDPGAANFPTSSWYNDTWPYRKRITLDATKVSADLTNFPVLINLPSDADLAARAQNDGDDLLLTASDGTTQLNHEIERFDGGTGELVLWANVTSLSSSSDTVLYLYYGNGAVGSQENATGVWESTFRGVWHLHDDFLDSTSYANSGANQGSTDATGIIADAQNFGGSEWVQVPHSSSLNISGTAASLSAWVRLSQAQPDDGGVVLKSTNSYEIHLGVEGTETGNVRINAQGAGYCRIDTQPLETDVWYYLTGTYDGTTTRVYLNGTEEATCTSQSGDILATTEPVVIGRRAIGDNRWFYGDIDEPRMIEATRTPDWLLTEYRNQVSPSTFYSVGPQISNPELRNPGLTPVSGDPSTFFNFTVEYASGNGPAAVKVNVSDATNATFNNFTMTPIGSPEADYFVQDSWAVEGSVTDFANAQSSTDGGASALLRQTISAGANFYQAVQLTEQSTTSTSWTAIPGTAVTFTPGSASEIWVVFASGELSSDTTGQTDYEVRMTINGTESILFSHQHFTGTQPNEAGFAVFDRITSTTSIQTIELQYRRLVAGTVRADNLRVVAGRLPPNADFQFAEATAVQQLTGSNLNILSMAFSPSSAGDYFVFGEVTHHEFPSGSTSTSWVEDDTAVDHPVSPNHGNARDPWNPLFVAFQRSLDTASKTFYVRGTSGNGGTEASEWQYARLMAFRADVWDTTYSSASLTESSTRSTSFQTKNSLVVPAPPSARDFLIIQAATIGGDNNATSHKAGELREDGATLVRTDHVINRDNVDYAHTIGAIHAKTTSASHTYTNGWLSPDGGTMDVFIRESTIIALRWPKPTLLVAFNTTGIRAPGEDTLVIRYNLTTNDDTFEVWIWDYTVSTWRNRGILERTVVGFFNYSLTADEKSGGTVQIRLNDTSNVGGTDLSLDYQLVNNTLWRSGVSFYYNTTLAVGSYDHFFWTQDDEGLVNQTTTFGGPVVAGLCDALSVETSDPSGELWFNETVEPDGFPYTTEVNVSASFQTGATPALRVTNDGSATCDITLRLMSNPGAGRSLKFNTTSAAPWPTDAAKKVPQDPSSVTVCTGVAPGGTCDIWLWVDYESAQGGLVPVDVRVESL
jgi:hypothetical protein